MENMSKTMNLAYINAIYKIMRNMGEVNLR